MSYYESLKDPRWQKRRLEIMQRDGFKCQLCGNDKKTLNVHHLKYNGEPWEAEDKHLITLCEPCHFTEESVDSRLPKVLKRINEFGVLKMEAMNVILAALDLPGDENMTSREAVLKSTQILKTWNKESEEVTNG